MRHKKNYFDIADIDLQEWQDLINFIAEIVQVPSAVITHLNGNDIEVVAASSNTENPFTTGDRVPFQDSGYYCETVINTKKSLVISNALLDENWRNCPDVALGLISYMGFPVLFPDGKPFGTICVLDSKENFFTPQLFNLLEKLRDLFQKHIETQIQTRQLRSEISKRKKIAATLEKKVTQRTKELVLAKEMAEQSSQIKTDFLANMSHELRTPMHAILSFASIGIQKSNDNQATDKLSGYFSRIYESGDRLLKLVNNLLDVSKFDSGKMNYDFQETDLHLLIINCMTELNVMAQQKKLQLNFPDQKPTLLRCDATRISQVITNLLSNAVKFSPEGKTITICLEEVQLSLGRRQSDTETMPALRLSIMDEGIGIPENELNLIFEKFAQSSQTKTSAGGTGLGLAICKEIVEAHRGKIIAENSATGGTVLSVYLPKNPACKKLQTYD